LGALVTAAKQDHDDLSLSTEIHPVAGARVNAKLLHAFADRAGVAEVAQADPSDALADAVAGASIPKPRSHAVKGS